MFLEHTTKSRIDTQQLILNNFNEYFIKIDYFDQKGKKNFENSVPLRYILNNNVNLPENNSNLEY